MTMNVLKYIKKSSIFLSIIAILVACNKETDTFTPYSNLEINDTSWSSNSMSNAKFDFIKNALSPIANTGTLGNAIASNYTFGNEATIAISPNSFLLNGVAFTDSIVTVAYKNFITKGDFIKNLLSTDNGNSLQEFSVGFSINFKDAKGNVLALKPNSKFDMDYFYNDATSRYKFYFGTEAVNTNSSFNWQIADSATQGYAYQTLLNLPTGGLGNGYKIKSYTTNFIGCFRPFANANSVAGNVSTSSNLTNKNTIVFSVLKNNNVIQRALPNIANHTFSYHNLPNGAAVTLVAISLIDNKFYLSTRNVVVANNGNYSLPSLGNPISIKALISYLDSL
jgi:hypothetical protein